MASVRKLVGKLSMCVALTATLGCSKPFVKKDNLVESSLFPAFGQEVERVSKDVSVVMLGTNHDYPWVSVGKVYVALPILKKKGFKHVMLECEKRFNPLVKEYYKTGNPAPLTLALTLNYKTSIRAMYMTIKRARELNMEARCIDNQGNLEDSTNITEEMFRKRDVYMAKKIGEVVERHGKVVALLGMLHTMPYREEETVRIMGKEYSTKTAARILVERYGKSSIMPIYLMYDYGKQRYLTDEEAREVSSRVIEWIKHLYSQ
ncbi:MAG: hypothetical protein D6769_03810 [Methanobacteriota archaeon]|nr:MAG: hypothetical protein D6769_03810 [Euryarchaeota archaeon]